MLNFYKTLFNIKVCQHLKTFPAVDPCKVRPYLLTATNDTKKLIPFRALLLACWTFISSPMIRGLLTNTFQLTQQEEGIGVNFCDLGGQLKSSLCYIRGPPNLYCRGWIKIIAKTNNPSVSISVGCFAWFEKNRAKCSNTSKFGPTDSLFVHAIAFHESLVDFLYPKLSSFSM